MSRDKNTHLRSAGRPADYRRLGIDPVEVAQFEDTHLDDGATQKDEDWPGLILPQAANL